MKTIESFQVDHLNLFPGLYLSRVDTLGDRQLYSYDLRMTAPNREPVMNIAEMHTLEHLGATFLRNDEQFGNEIIYFGPMGCRTGFYLILTDQVTGQDVRDLVRAAFEFAANFEGEIPGASAAACGNYLDHNLPMARYLAAKYVEVLDQIADFDYQY